MTPLLLAWALALQDPSMDSLLEGLRADDPGARARAMIGILKGWKGWAEKDLSSLDDASIDGDPEVSARATDARSLIRIRRTLGVKLVDAISRADEAFHTGGDAAKLDVLILAKAFWIRGDLAREDLAGLERVAAGATWTDPGTLPRFMKEFDGGRALSIPGDPAARVRLRARAVEELGGEGKKRLAQVVESLGDEEPEVRATALRVIGGLDAREQAPKIASQLRDPDPTVRREALSLLGGWGAKEYATDCVRLLEDPNGQIRRRAVETLAGWGQKGVAPDIAKLLKDRDGSSRAEAATALGVLGAREFAGDLAPLLSDVQPAVRRSAAFAIGRVGGMEHASKIEALLADRESDVRMTAVQALGQLGVGLRVEAVVPLLGDPDTEVRLEAAWVLGRVAPKAAMLRMLQLENRDPGVRHGLARILGRMGLEECRKPIGLLCSDPCAWVRAEAVESLGRLGGKEGMGVISALLRDPDRKVRLNAALALGELGSGDPEGALAALERDRDRLLGLASTLSLIRLGLRGAGPLRVALGEIGSDDLAFAVLGTAALETLSRVRSKEAWDRLARPLVVKKSVETWKDLTEALAGAGLALEVEADCGIGRLDEHLGVTGYQALEWLLGRVGRPAIVLDGSRVRLMDRRPALVWWQKRLDGK
jgi:HEAT repeat protein